MSNIAETYDRYEKFRENGVIGIVPFIEISPKSTDQNEVYKRGITRLDVLSYKYYYNPNYGWLIMQANPQYGSMEFEIPDGVTLRIPYPLDATITAYEKAIESYFQTASDQFLE